MLGRGTLFVWHDAAWIIKYFLNSHGKERQGRKKGLSKQNICLLWCTKAGEKEEDEDLLI